MPYNDLPKLAFPAGQFDTVPILKQARLSAEALARLDARAGTLPNAYVLAQPLFLSESLASSSIENIHSTPKEVLQANLLPEAEQTGAAKEVLHYIAGLRRGFELESQNGFLTTNMLVEIQGLIEPSKPGIRRLPLTVSNRDTGAVIYTPPDGEPLLRDLLGDMERFINSDEDGHDPLVKMALLHHQFECIHPFLDGNGRVGRILMLLYLVCAGLLHIPCLFLSGYILAHKGEYYAHLSRTTSTRDYEPFILFLLKAVEEQSQVTMDRLLKIEGIRDEIETESTAVNPHALSQMLISKYAVTLKEAGEQLDISRPTAVKYLDELVKKGLLTEEVIRGQKYYFSPRFLEVLS